MKRTIALLIVTAGIGLGQTAPNVYVTPAGKAYHKTARCGTLSRSKVVLEVSRSSAAENGLTEHRTCHRVASDGTALPEWLKNAKVVERVVEKGGAKE